MRVRLPRRGPHAAAALGATPPLRTRHRLGRLSPERRRRRRAVAARAARSCGMRARRPRRRRMRTWRRASSPSEAFARILCRRSSLSARLASPSVPATLASTWRAAAAAGGGARRRRARRRSRARGGAPRVRRGQRAAGEVCRTPMKQLLPGHAPERPGRAAARPARVTTEARCGRRSRRCRPPPGRHRRPMAPEAQGIPSGGPRARTARHRAISAIRPRALDGSSRSLVSRASMSMIARVMRAARTRLRCGRRVCALFAAEIDRAAPPRSHPCVDPSGRRTRGAQMHAHEQISPAAIMRPPASPCWRPTKDVGGALAGIAFTACAAQVKQGGMGRCFKAWASSVAPQRDMRI
jgi:hypothetical protein